MVSSGLSRYLNSPLYNNVLDLTRIFSFGTIVILHLTERWWWHPYGYNNETMFVLQGFLYIAMFTRLLDYMRGIERIAVLVHLIITAGKDFYKFIWVLMVLWLGLALAVDAQVEGRSAGATIPQQ